MRALFCLSVSLWLLTLLSPALLSAQQQAGGRVYLDSFADRRPATYRMSIWGPT